MGAEPATGPLAGVRIVDLSTVVLGPFATQILGDLGAEIIKVEPPGGDMMRHTGDSPTPGMGPIYLQMNRNKRSVVLDVKTKAGKQALTALLQSADVFFHNVRGAAMARLGFDYDAVVKIKPDIVYVHCVGYGSAGPYAGRPAYDDLVQAACGVPDLLSLASGDETPRYLPTVIADKTGGLHAVYAAVAALFHRERTGQGQFVEVPLMESFAAFMLAENLYGHTFVPPRGGVGYPRALDRNRRPHKTSDGYIALLPYSEQQWQRFFDAAGRFDALCDERFATHDARVANYNALYGLVSDIVATKTTQQWVALLDKADIAYVVPNDLADVINDRHLRESGFVTERVHPSEGRYVSLEPPVKFSASPSKVRRDAPRLGEDTRQVLREAGVDESIIDAVLAGASSTKR